MSEKMKLFGQGLLWLLGTAAVGGLIGFIMTIFGLNPFQFAPTAFIGCIAGTIFQIILVFAHAPVFHQPLPSRTKVYGQPEWVTFVIQGLATALGWIAIGGIFMAGMPFATDLLFWLLFLVTSMAWFEKWGWWLLSWIPYGPLWLLWWVVSGLWSKKGALWAFINRGGWLVKTIKFILLLGVFALCVALLFGAFS